MKLIDTRVRKVAYVHRLNEPDETPSTPKVTQAPRDDITLNDFGVSIRHDDLRGSSLYPWSRVLRIDYRDEEMP